MRFAIESSQILVVTGTTHRGHMQTMQIRTEAQRHLLNGLRLDTRGNVVIDSREESQRASVVDAFGGRSDRCRVNSAAGDQANGVKVLGAVADSLGDHAAKGLKGFIIRGKRNRRGG